MKMRKGARKRVKMKEAKAAQDQHHLYEGGSGEGDYTGYKWGMFLRAPEIFFTLKRKCTNTLVPLGQIAEIKFGTKTGCDEFFFPYDITDKAVAETISDREFKDHYGIRRSDTEDIRILLAGKKEVKLIEAEYLEPEIHSLRDNKLIDIDVDRLARKVLMISKTKYEVRKQYVLKYIEWGEKQGYHEGTSVKGRISSDRGWYDLTWAPRPDLIFPKIQQYRHIISTNTSHLICNSSLLAVFSQKVSPELLCAVLNSTITALFKQYFARIHGREGSLQLDVYSARIMPVADPREASNGVAKRLKKALAAMRSREATPLVDVDSEEPALTGDLTFSDRQELDDAVLELLGFTNPKLRAAIQQEIYFEITKIYRQIRAGELVMRRYRSITARAGRPTPHSIADEIWDQLGDKPTFKSPLDFLPPKIKLRGIDLPEGRARIIKGNLFESNGVQIGDVKFETDDMLSAILIKRLSDMGFVGKLPIPVDPLHCREVLEAHDEYVNQTNQAFNELAAALTSDENIQGRVVRELWKRMRR
jgi:hypothetical protein